MKKTWDKSHREISLVYIWGLYTKMNQFTQNDNIGFEMK
jgi:hypothetical protein